MATFRPGKPRWRLRRTTDFTLTGGAHDIPWQVADFDDEAEWDNSTKITIQRSGLYVVAFHLSLGTTASNGTPTVYVGVNATTFTQLRGSTNTLSQGLGLTTLLELATGDTVIVGAQRHSSASSTLQGVNCGFSGTRIGPVRWTS